MSENNETTYVSLRNDLLFHMVFTRNEEALKGLLSVLLNIPEERIERAEVLNPMQYSEAIDTKLTVLDIKVHLNDSTYILVEMQVRKFDEWINRTVVYTCRQVADQAHDEFDYSKLEPVIQISIMDYTPGAGEQGLILMRSVTPSASRCKGRRYCYWRIRPSSSPCRSCIHGSQRSSCG